MRSGALVLGSNPHTPRSATEPDRYDAIELPVVILVTSIFVVIEQLARELQTPFENAPDDTPMNAICVTIETDLRQMLGDRDLPAQEQPVRGVLM